MATYYVDDGGSATSPYDTWAKAATSLSALDDAVSLASDDIVYIGHDHVCQYSHSANRTITGPASGKPCYIISATQGSSPPAYQASTTNQIDTSEGAYQLSFDGCFALFGVCMAAGARLQFAQSDSNESGYAQNCTFKLAANSDLYFGGQTDRTVLVNCTISCAADTGASSTAVISGNAGSVADLIGCTFVSGTNRTGIVLNCNGASFVVSGCDFTTFTNVTTCEITTQGQAIVSNCITAGTWTPYSTAGTREKMLFTNVGPADAPTYVYLGTYYGDCTSDTTVYRTGGGSVEGTACSWKVTTNANTSEGTPFWTPWMYGVISSTGSKTFTVYIANNTADLTDAEAWLEVEYLGTSDEANTTLATDRRTITTTAVAQTDDTGSTWNGATLTYAQSLAVTATVNEDGLYRARVAIAKASATVYVDPKVP